MVSAVVVYHSETLVIIIIHLSLLIPKEKLGMSLGGREAATL
jgi:hypothetical protein